MIGFFILIFLIVAIMIVIYNMRSGLPVSVSDPNLDQFCIDNSSGTPVRICQSIAPDKNQQGLVFKCYNGVEEWSNDVIPFNESLDNALNNSSISWYLRKDVLTNYSVYNTPTDAIRTWCAPSNAANVDIPDPCLAADGSEICEMSSSDANGSWFMCPDNFIDQSYFVNYVTNGGVLTNPYNATYSSKEEAIRTVCK